MAIRTKLTALLVVLAMTLTWTGVAAAEDAAAEPDLVRGAELFQLCAQCHGADGHGNKIYLAPAIAGLGTWYVEMQLNEFRTGLRGLHFDDIAGMRMRPMSMTLRDDADVRDVAAYVATLAKADPGPTLEGNAEAGAPLYVLCAACHGPNGDGIEAMKSPALNHLDDWYMIEQLTKFKAGVRGTAPGDPYGVLMGPSSPMALTLKDEQAVRDVVAHIMTLD
jgi:cytochrome c oxidase subunit 2